MKGSARTTTLHGWYIFAYTMDMLADKHTRKMAIMATTHCLIGCGIGEVLGMVIGTALAWSNGATMALAIILAFLFGYSFTFFPLIPKMGVRPAFRTALVADSVSITSMEVIDNAVLLLIPGALHAGLDEPFFWISLAIALVVAFVVTVPVNYWMIARGKGHAVVHSHHDHPAEDMAADHEHTHHH